MGDKTKRLDIGPATMGRSKRPISSFFKSIKIRGVDKSESREERHSYYEHMACDSWYHGELFKHLYYSLMESSTR